MRFNKNMIVRVSVLIVLLINQLLIGFRFDALPFSDEQIYEGLSTVATVIMSIVTTYYDTDVTKQARQNKEILKERGLK